VWNPGEHVEGYTNFLWMVLLAGMHRAGMDLVPASLLLAYASLLAMMLLVWRIWSLWADEAAGAIAMPVVLAVALIAIGLNDGLVTWGMSGLETPLAAALLTATVYLYLREARDARRPPWSSLAAVAAAMTRPELMLIAGVTGAFTLGDAVATRDRAALRRAALWALIFAVLYGAYFVWRYSYYGYVFPNTYYVKVGSNIDFLRRGLDYVRENVLKQWFLPFLAGAGLLLFERAGRIGRDMLYVWAIISAWLLGVVYEGGDAFSHARFLAPIVPVLFLAGVLGWTRLLERIDPAGRRAAIAGGVAAALVGFALAASSIDAKIGQDRNAEASREELGRWLRGNVPPQYRIAVFAAGGVPYYSQLPAIDMFGLSDETIAHTDVPDFGKGVIAHEKYNTSYVLTSVRPEIIIAGDAAPVVITKELLQQRSQVQAINDLFGDARTFELYEPVAVRLPGGWYSFLQRKDTLGSVTIDWSESGGYGHRAAEAAR
jgi:hypothetical protein